MQRERRDRTDDHEPASTQPQVNRDERSEQAKRLDHQARRAIQALKAATEPQD